MRGRYQEFLDRGGDLVAIGMGNPAMAAHFRDEEKIPFRLLVDHDQESYEALALRHATGFEIYGPKQVFKSAINVMKGHKIALARQDYHQLGGAAVIAPDGEAVFVHRAKDSSDNVSADALLDALGKAKG